MNVEAVTKLVDLSVLVFQLLAQYNIDASKLNAAIAAAAAAGTPFDPQPFMDDAQARINAINIAGAGVAGQAMANALKDA